MHVMTLCCYFIRGHFTKYEHHEHCASQIIDGCFVDVGTDEQERIFTLYICPFTSRFDLELGTGRLKWSLCMRLIGVEMKVEYFHNQTRDISVHVTFALPAWSLILIFTLMSRAIYYSVSGFSQREHGHLSIEPVSRKRYKLACAPIEDSHRASCGVDPDGDRGIVWTPFRPWKS